MAAMQSGASFSTIAEKWHALAQRRLAYICELARSGRWKRYYTEEEYASCLRDAERAVMLWAQLASQQTALPRRSGDVRPAA